jgi:primosomal protein N' (replication factor Y)
LCCAPFVSGLRHTGLVIAAVAVDVPLPHLDRTFDYRVPAELEADIAVGQRVRVRFAGRIVTGFVLRLHDDPTHATVDVRAVVAPTIVLPPAMAELIRAVADRYASTFADVMRFAVPPRHGRAEATALAAGPIPSPAAAAFVGELGAVRGIAAFLQRIERGESLAACVELPSLLDLPQTVARLAKAAVKSGSVLVVAPDARDVERIRAALLAMDIAPVVMQAGVGPAGRQRAFTEASIVERHVVLGTRSAVFAPLRGHATTIMVGDGNDALVEPHTPGWHAREVALLRNSTHGWSSLFVARHRSVEMQALVEQGAVKSLVWPVDQWRRLSTRVEAVPERLDDADPLLRQLRIPPSVFRAVRETLASGAVVLSVPKRGYVTSVRCAGCRELARCAKCSGPLVIAAAGEQARCGLCGTADWQCPWCNGTQVRHQGLGTERTREELGRAFPNVPVRIVDAEHPLDAIPATPQLLLITPGAEPDGRAPLAVVLDADAVLGRHDLSAGIEGVRRWLDVASLVSSGGRMLIVGSSTAPAVQALVRSDPMGFAAAQLKERREVGLPPALHAAVLEAPAGNMAAAEIRDAVLGAIILGPTRVGEGQRWIVLHRDLAPLVAGVRAVLARRSAAKTIAGMSIRIDPLELAT